MSLQSHIVSHREDLFFVALFLWILIGQGGKHPGIHAHSGTYLLWATPPLTSEVNAPRPTRTKETWGRETTATQNIIIEVICSVCFGVANVISTLLIFNVLKCLRARWQVLVERICCLWVDLNQWEELYDVLDAGLNGRNRGRTMTGPQRPDTRHWSSWSAGHINTECPPHLRMSIWLKLQYNFVGECDEEAELFLLRPSSLREAIRSALKAVTSRGKTHGTAQLLVWAEPTRWPLKLRCRKKTAFVSNVKLF